MCVRVCVCVGGGGGGGGGGFKFSQVFAPSKFELENFI